MRCCDAFPSEVPIRFLNNLGVLEDHIIKKGTRGVGLIERLKTWDIGRHERQD